MFSIIPLITLLSLTFNIQDRDPKTHKITMGGCSAVYVAPDEALSAAHCLEGTTGNMWVRNSSNQAFKVGVIKVDKRIDLCLLKLYDAPKHKFVKLGRPPKVGDRVYSMGNDDRMPFTYGEGKVKNILIDDMTHTLTIVHSASILAGASGGGLFNKGGQLIGINVMSFQGVSFAVDITVVEGFLGKRGSRR